MPVAAPLIVAAGTIGGGLLASKSASKAANTAAAATTASDQAAIGEQRRQFGVIDAQEAPFREFGTSALGPLGDLLGLNGKEASAAAIAGLKDSPQYSALFGNGENTVLANASATGGVRGGNTQRSLADFGRDTLATVIESQLGRLGGAAELGQDAVARSGTFGAHSADAISQLLQDQGAAKSGAALAGGAASVGAIKDITGALAALANNNKVQTAVGKLF